MYTSFHVTGKCMANVKDATNPQLASLPAVSARRNLLCLSVLLMFIQCTLVQSASQNRKFRTSLWFVVRTRGTLEMSLFAMYFKGSAKDCNTRTTLDVHR